MMEVINYIATYILGVPAILIGIVACIGLIVQKKAFHEIMAGTFKTIIGFMMISFPKPFLKMKSAHGRI